MLTGDAVNPMTATRAARDPWLDLIEELDAWRAEDLQVRFWWRDDDAVAATPALERLLDLSTAYNVPVGLSVIPYRAESDLAVAVGGQSLVSVLQHGITHENHAEPGIGPPIELGGTLPLEEVVHELVEAWRRLSAMFGRRCLPVLVPPWNQIPDVLVARLPAIGYRGLSASGRRHGVAGLIEAHGHIQPIEWRGGAHFAGTEIAMEMMLRHLRNRRSGRWDRAEPIGLLTHHLETDSDTWNFLQCLVAVTRMHPAVAWLAPAQVFALDGRDD